MSTVFRRTFISSPARDAHATWMEVVAFLTRGQEGKARTELLSVAGPATSIIADGTPQNAPIIVTSDGPRTRIYCLYGDDALDGANANEDVAAFDPLNGDWAVSLPCAAEDLDWVSAALAAQSARITARDAALGIVVEEAQASAGPLTLNVKGFLGHE